MKDNLRLADWQHCIKASWQHVTQATLHCIKASWQHVTQATFHRGPWSNV